MSHHDHLERIILAVSRLRHASPRGTDWTGRPLIRQDDGRDRDLDLILTEARALDREARAKTPVEEQSR